jgi:hypothetical protein
MLMMSSGLVNQRVLAESEGRVQRLLKSGKTDAEIVEELYLAAYARWPTEMEKQKILQEIFPFGTDRKRAAENLAWTLLNGIEFVLNH